MPPVELPDRVWKWWSPSPCLRPCVHPPPSLPRHPGVAKHRSMCVCRCSPLAQMPRSVRRAPAARAALTGRVLLAARPRYRRRATGVARPRAEQPMRWLPSARRWAVVDDTVSPLLTPDGWRTERSSRAGWTARDTDWYFFGHGRKYPRALADFISVAGDVPLMPRDAYGVWCAPAGPQAPA